MPFSLFNSIALPIVVLECRDENDFVIIYNNLSYGEALKSAGVVLGQSSLEAFGQSHADRLNKAAWQALQTGQQRQCEIVLDGAEADRRFDAKLMPYPNAGQRLVVASLTEIEDSASREARLDQDFEREQFIALAAHDLRGPWRSISAIAELLKEDFVDHGDGKLELIEMIEHLGEKASAQTDRVLNYVIAGDLCYAAEEVNLPEMALDILALYDPNNQVALDVQDAVLRTDAAALQVMVRNLIDNAVKHGGRPDLRLAITARQVRDGQIALTVSDDGDGFPQSLNLSKIGQSHRHRGFGLRSISRILRGRNGSINQAPSSFGRGAGVELRFPGRLLDAVGIRSAG